jgi:hypothetical protein
MLSSSGLPMLAPAPPSPEVNTMPAIAEKRPSLQHRWQTNQPQRPAAAGQLRGPTLALTPP